MWELIKITRISVIPQKLRILEALFGNFLEVSNSIVKLSQIKAFWRMNCRTGEFVCHQWELTVLCRPWNWNVTLSVIILHMQGTICYQPPDLAVLYTPTLCIRPGAIFVTHIFRKKMCFICHYMVILIILEFFPLSVFKIMYCHVT